MPNAILTVSQLTKAIKGQLEGNFPFVWVRGQVSNCSRPSSGHMYFSLKDDDAIVNAVWFKGNQKEAEAFDPLTGEVFEDGPKPSLAACLENGQEIICAGKLTVYPPRGAYQLVVELAQDAGRGRLQIEYERIKKELLAKGYFDPGRKRSLPGNPTRVAVVTATAGAAIRDFLRISESRGITGEIRIYPALVQGTQAPEQIASALARIAEDAWAEVAVLIRGGGSLEDLWAFNTEIVADAVFSAPIPVLAGIGHEVDFSIADLVADVRAATPTHAAQLLWTERHELMQRVDELELSLSRMWEYRLTRKEAALDSLTKALTWLSPVKNLERWEERLAACLGKIDHSFYSTLDQKSGYLARLTTQFSAAFEKSFLSREHALERFALRLEGLDPMRPLERGYTLAKTRNGSFARSVLDIIPGERFELILHDGSLPARAEHETTPPGK